MNFESKKTRILFFYRLWRAKKKQGCFYKLWKLKNKNFIIFWQNFRKLVITKVPHYEPDEVTRIRMKTQPLKKGYGPFGWNELQEGMIITSYFNFYRGEMKVEPGMDLPPDTDQVRAFKYHHPP